MRFRQLLSLVGLLLLPFSLAAQESGMACHGSFAEFASDAEFRAQHPSPEAISDEDLKGVMKTLPNADGKDVRAYFVAGREGSDQYLFVFQEWWGLNNHIKQTADAYHEKLRGEVNVIALDLYDGKVAEDPERAGKLMQSADSARLTEIVRTGLAHAGEDAEIGSIGWCFGGGWSLKTALMAGDRATACVMYYGMPVLDVNRLQDLHTDVLGIFAEQDKWVNQGVVSDFRSAMQMAGQHLRVHTYDADHAFANPSGKAYAEEAATDARRKTVSYLREQFGVR